MYVEVVLPFALLRNASHFPRKGVLTVILLILLLSFFRYGIDHVISTNAKSAMPVVFVFEFVKFGLQQAAPSSFEKTFPRLIVTIPPLFQDLKFEIRCHGACESTNRYNTSATNLGNTRCRQWLISIVPQTYTV